MLGSRRDKVVEEANFLETGGEKGTLREFPVTVSFAEIGSNLNVYDAQLEFKIAS